MQLLMKQLKIQSRFLNNGILIPGIIIKPVTEVEWDLGIVSKIEILSLYEKIENLPYWNQLLNVENLGNRYEYKANIEEEYYDDENNLLYQSYNDSTWFFYGDLIKTGPTNFKDGSGIEYNVFIR